LGRTGGIVLAVTTLGPAGSFDAAWDGAIAQRLRACAEEISPRLGSTSQASPDRS
jgi:DNA-binding IclR family transcriptional regulator